MAFLFPDPGNCVRLARSPLTEVICQLRFPPILRIAQDSPAQFQERVRARFPDYQVQLPLLVGPVAAMVEGGNIEAKPRLHRFETSPAGTYVVLAPDFVAMGTTSYGRWEQFSEQLGFVIDAFRATYEPADGTRLGLRYRNLITPALVGRSTLQEVRLLLNDALRTAQLSDVLDDPLRTLCEVRARVGGDASAPEFLTLRSELVNTPDASPGCSLDFDYYCEGRIASDTILGRCARYHERIYRAFRWTLAPDALAAFEPQEVEE